MDSKKTLDFAAGRLAKNPTRHGRTRPRPKKGSSYGAARLGIVPEKNDPEFESLDTTVEAPATPVAPPEPAAPAMPPEPTAAAAQAPFAAPVAPAAPPQPAMAAPVASFGQEPEPETPQAPPVEASPEVISALASLRLDRRPKPQRRPDPTPRVATVSGTMGRLRTLNVHDISEGAREIFTGVSSLLSSCLKRKKLDELEEEELDAAEAEAAAAEVEEDPDAYKTPPKIRPRQG